MHNYSPSNSASSLSSCLCPLQSLWREQEQQPQSGDHSQEQHPRSIQWQSVPAELQAGGQAFWLLLAWSTMQEGAKGWHKGPFGAGHPAVQSPYS